VKPPKGAARSGFHAKREPGETRKVEEMSEKERFRRDYERGTLGAEPAMMNRAERRRARRHMRRKFGI